MIAPISCPGGAKMFSGSWYSPITCERTPADLHDLLERLDRARNLSRMPLLQHDDRRAAPQLALREPPARDELAAVDLLIPVVGAVR